MFPTVWAALSAPDQFTRAVHERGGSAGALQPGDGPLFLSLVATASGGVGLYGAAMHANEGVLEMARHGLGAVLAAGTAWAATLPALYVVGSLVGSKLAARSVALAALVTVSFGGLAMLASIPVLWFFELALPFSWVRIAVPLVSFAGVGLCMCDVFLRVMRALEGPRLVHLAWLGLLSLVGLEMFVLFGLFDMGGGA